MYRVQGSAFVGSEFRLGAFFMQALGRFSVEGWYKLPLGK